MILRCFPLWMRPAVAMFLPSSWRLHAHLRQAKMALLPIIARRRAAQSQPNYVKPDDFLQWMMDTGVGEEQRPEKLAHLQLILILASVDTTTRAGAHAIYDMCARHEYFEPLREEIETVLREDQGWGKPTLTRMRKMDSFLRESQRLSPASLCTSPRAFWKSSTEADPSYSRLPPDRQEPHHPFRRHALAIGYTHLPCFRSNIQRPDLRSGR